MSECKFIRGGSWDGFWDHLRIANSLWFDAVVIDYAVGFRVVQDPGSIVIKCGSWDNFQGCLNTGRCGNAFAKDREYFLGFRVVER